MQRCCVRLLTVAAAIWQHVLKSVMLQKHTKAGYHRFCVLYDLKTQSQTKLTKLKTQFEHIRTKVWLTVSAKPRTIQDLTPRGPGSKPSLPAATSSFACRAAIQFGPVLGIGCRSVCRPSVCWRFTKRGRERFMSSI